MRLYVLVLIALLARQAVSHAYRERRSISLQDAKSYLEKYGYTSAARVLGRAQAKIDQIHEIKETLRQAIRQFQAFAGLRQSGEIDEATATKMSSRRCGVADILTIRDRGSYKWNKHDLTYSFLSFSPDLSHDTVRRAIAQAFDAWSAVTPLRFTEVPFGGDILIKFASHSHGDPWPFDGRGGVLAHATMPTNGKLHFDEDENWVYMDADRLRGREYTDLLTVAIHEIGHTLGLDHSRDERSIMAPFYQETVDSRGNYIMPRLNTDDIAKIQAIYGGPSERSSFGSSRGSSSVGLDRSSSFGGFDGRYRGDSDDFGSARTPSRSGFGHGSMGGNGRSSSFGGFDDSSRRDFDQDSTPKPRGFFSKLRDRLFGNK